VFLLSARNEPRARTNWHWQVDASGLKPLRINPFRSSIKSNSRTNEKPHTALTLAPGRSCSF